MLWGNCMSYSQITGGEGEKQHCKWISALCRIPPIPTCHSLLEYRLPQIPINNLHVYSRTEKQKWWWLHMYVQLSFWKGLFCIITLHHLEINCFVCMYVFFLWKYWRIYCHWFMQKNKCELIEFHLHLMLIIMISMIHVLCSVFTLWAKKLTHSLENMFL